MNKISTSLLGMAQVLYLGFVLLFSILFLLKFLRKHRPVPQFSRLRERTGE